MTVIMFWGAVAYLAYAVAEFIVNETIRIPRMKRRIAHYQAMRYRYELATWLHCDVDDV